MAQVSGSGAEAVAVEDRMLTKKSAKQIKSKVDYCLFFNLNV